MNILFDLLHPSDVNLFKNNIFYFESIGHKVYITLRYRGNLEKIARVELSGFKIDTIGNHKRNFFSKILALLSREFQMFKYLKKNKISVSVNQGYGNILACKLLHIPFINFEDDYEYKLAFYYAKWLSKKDIMPSFIPVKGRNIIKYNGYKELAYLHPKYLKLNNNVLEQLNLLPKQYIFIREISNVSLNYSDFKSVLPGMISYLKKFNFTLVLSLEDKNLLSLYKNDCLILEEPVKEFYTLIKESLFVISSGDTMAREACLLGVPAIYTGGRNMLANSEFIHLKVMTKVENIDEFKVFLEKIINSNFYKNVENIINDKINSSWDDTTDVIKNQILETINF